MKIQSFQRNLIVIGLLLAPFLSVGELHALFNGELLSQSENLTGLFKTSKDILFILLILLGFVSYLLSNRINKNVIPYFIAVTISVLPAIILSSSNDLTSIASGLRWLLPIILPIFIYRAVNQDLLQALTLYLCALLVLHFFFQIFELFYAYAWYGSSTAGFNLRNPGFFLIPNTGAFFSIAVLYVVLFIGNMSVIRKFIFTMLGSASVFLTMSAAGFATLLIIIIFYYFNRIKSIFLFLFLPLFFISTYYFLEFFLSNRGGFNFIKNSGGPRFDIMVDRFFGADFISSSFGFGTNTFVMLGDGAVLDSTYASLLVNLGYFGFFIFIIMLLIALFYSIFTRNKSQFVFLVVFSSFAFTNIVYEVYPVNLIMAVVIVFFIKYSRKITPHQVNRHEISHVSSNGLK
jgi:hypothetical protein